MGLPANRVSAVHAAAGPGCASCNHPAAGARPLGFVMLISMTKQAPGGKFG